MVWLLFEFLCFVFVHLFNDKQAIAQLGFHKDGVNRKIQLTHPLLNSLYSFAEFVYRPKRIRSFHSSLSFLRCS
nr:MAG TPA: hypothetical protein [Caudoviricetes sp.]